MKFKDMTIEQLEERRAAIAAEVDTEGADLDALQEEVRSINAELENRKADEAKKAEIRAKVATGFGEVVETGKKEEVKGMDEIRNSKDYINAFASYIKTGDDSECRALLSKNVTGGQVPVPTYIEGRIRTAWERNGLMNLVRKTYLKGNLQIGFELSASGAVVHTEGEAAPAEETLTFGVVNMVPQSIKKWIRISDEVVDLGGEEFLNYIYDEITYQIAKEAIRVLINKIVAAPGASSATEAGVPSVSGSAGDLSIVAMAMSMLSDDAANPVIVMNKRTMGDFVQTMAGSSYKFDPFEGYEVHYTNALPYINAPDIESGATWMIVGDFGVGALANFPNGDEIRVKYDDLTEAQADLVKLVGREYIALGVVAPDAFVKVTL